MSRNEKSVTKKRLISVLVTETRKWRLIGTGRGKERTQSRGRKDTGRGAERTQNGDRKDKGRTQKNTLTYYGRHSTIDEVKLF